MNAHKYQVGQNVYFTSGPISRPGASGSYQVLKRMTLIAPRRAILWLDLAHSQESLGALSAARAGYEKCLTLARPGEDISNEAAFALHALKRRLN